MSARWPRQFSQGFNLLWVPLRSVKRIQKCLHFWAVYPLFMVQDGRAMNLLEAHSYVVLYVARADAATWKDVDPPGSLSLDFLQ